MSCNQCDIEFDIGVSEEEDSFAIELAKCRERRGAEKKLEVCLGDCSIEYDIDKIIVGLGKYCIRNNFYRKGNDFHHLTRKELDIINRMIPNEEPGIRGGYIFLDDNGGKEGLVRLYVCGCDPKWWFTEVNGKIEFDIA